MEYTHYKEDLNIATKLFLCYLFNSWRVFCETSARILERKRQSLMNKVIRTPWGEILLTQVDHSRLVSVSWRHTDGQGEADRVAVPGEILFSCAQSGEAHRVPLPNHICQALESEEVVRWLENLHRNTRGHDVSTHN
jgi:hypothetical protein